MSDYLHFRNRIMAISAGLLVSAEVFCLLSGFYSVALGLALGGGWSLVKLLLHAYHIRKFTNCAGTGKKVRYSVSGNLSRYLITAAVLAAAFAAPSINEWAAVGGVFLANTVMIVCSVLEGHTALTTRQTGGDK